MNNLLDKANAYINRNENSTKNHPIFHYTAPIGWINDPNGLCYFKGEYHLYYQYNPYGIHWDTMYWGHATSKDLIHWEHKPVALAPEESYERDGCFSGSAIEVNNKLYIMYTGHLDRNNRVRQNQNIAISQDGLTFKKIEANPVLKEMDLPKGSQPEDFRDPKVFEYKGSYWSVIVGRPKEQGGAVLLYRSDNLIHWDYVGIIDESDIGREEIWECPDLFKLQDTDVLILSIIDLQQTNMHPTIYKLGNVDLENSRGEWNYTRDLDCGFSFYAPQTFLDSKGQRIMIGWMSPWDADDAVRLENGWAGMMATPRVLTIEDGRLVQKPVDSIVQLRQDNGEYIKEKVIDNESLSFDNVSGQHFDLSFEVDISEADSFTIELAKGKKNSTQLSYNVHTHEWIFDSNDIRKVQEDCPRENLEFRVLMDRYSIEIFADGGKRVFTAFIDPDEDARDIVFLCEGKTALYNVEFYALI